MESFTGTITGVEKSRNFKNNSAANMYLRYIFVNLETVPVYININLGNAWICPKDTKLEPNQSCTDEGLVILSKQDLVVQFTGKISFYVSLTEQK